MQAPEAKEGFIATLNSMGFMTTGLDPCSQAWVDFAPTAPAPALEIGAAYGVATLQALAKGISVIANDLDARHLAILKAKADADRFTALRLLPGAFPHDITLPEESVGAVLLCRILHFLDGKTLREGFSALYRWVKTGGKIFIVAETVYVQTMTSLIPTYEKRVKNGEEWPGYFDTIHQAVPHLKDKLPPAMHFLDEAVLQREVKRVGFRVDKSGTLARTDFPSWLQWDGRESVFLIASK